MLLTAYNNIENDGIFHRALADSEMTARLWLRMIEDLERGFNIAPVSFSPMNKISRHPKGKVQELLSKQRG